MTVHYAQTTFSSTLPQTPHVHKSEPKTPTHNINKKHPVFNESKRTHEANQIQNDIPTQTHIRQKHITREPMRQIKYTEAHN
jgi:hypothetical protein